MNKEQGKGTITITTNEQRIVKKFFLFKEQKHQQLQLRMNRAKRRGASTTIYRNFTLKECEDGTHTPEMGTWESSKTPEKSGFNCKGQNPFMPLERS